MERFEFITSDYFDKTVELYGLESLKINDIEEEVKKHLIFDIDVAWKIESWDLLDNGNLEVFIDIRQVIQLYLNIVLENQNGTLLVHASKGKNKGKISSGKSFSKK